MAATRLLARGWFRGRRGGWLGTSAVLAATLTLLVLVSALFAGMEAETESRVADIFTDDLRVTPRETGVFGPGRFDPATEAVTALGAGATARMESQMVLSRRSFESILSQGDETPVIQGPGSAGGDDSVSLGVLVGADFADGDIASSYRDHLVTGRLPGVWAGPGGAAPQPIELAISVRTLGGFLTTAERDKLSSWPPPISEISPLRLDITAGVARDGDYRNDVYRNSARIVGLFDTGVDTLDSFTAWGPIEASRFLLGEDLDDDVANVILVRGNAATARAVAADNDWATESSGEFTKRYLGQLIEALQTLSVVTASVLFTIPAFLVAHGVERVLEAQRREVAVLRAVGVPGRTVRGALARLVTLTMFLAVVAAAAVVGLLGIALHGILPNWDAAPLPLDVSFSPVMVVGAVVVASASVLVAYWIAVRSQRRMDVAQALRTA
jgi:ABC-type lipoprotein release transport system permease subunit